MQIVVYKRLNKKGDKEEEAKIILLFALSILVRYMSKFFVRQTQYFV